VLNKNGKIGTLDECFGDEGLKLWGNKINEEKLMEFEVHPVWQPSFHPQRPINFVKPRLALAYSCF